MSSRSELFSSIPSGLKEIPQWIVWKAVPKADEKVSKEPYSIYTGCKCNIASSKNYASFNDALAYLQEASSEFAGIGLCLTKELQLIGFDLDDAFDKGGKLKSWAEELLDMLPEQTYIERSPSRQGLRFFLKGCKPSQSGCKKKLPNGVIEVYELGRFLTVTGDRYREGLKVPLAQDTIDNIFNKWFQKPVNQSDDELLVFPTHDLPDEEVKERMFASKNGVKIKSLWDGDTTEHGNDDSAADQALLSHLAYWTAKNKEQMERLFSESQLGQRSKWQGREDYRERSIKKAIEFTKSTYKPSKSQSNKEKSVEPIKSWTAEKLMNTHFEPIVWVVENLIPEGLTVLASPPKTGKSGLCLQLSLAVATGGLAMNKLKVQQGEVIYCALEDSKRRIKDRLSSMLKGEKPKDLTQLEIVFDLAPLDKNGLEQIEELIKSRPSCKLFIVDTLSRVTPEPNKNKNAYDNDYKNLAPLQKLALKYHIALIVVTHFRKQESSDPLQKVMGSTGLTGVSDTIMLLKRVRGGAKGTLYVTGRDIVEEEYSLEFKPSEGFWALTGTVNELKISQERQDIMELMRNEGSSVSPTFLAKMLGNSYGNTKALLSKMTKDGQLTTLSRGKYCIKEA